MDKFDLIMYIVILMFLWIYFYPTYKAVSLRKSFFYTIFPLFLLNVFLGFSVAGWYVCLAFAHRDEN